MADKPQPMGLKQAVDVLGRIHAAYPDRDLRLSIMVTNPGAIGGTPGVPVVAMFEGFDWDRGVLLVQPAQPLTVLTPQQVQDISDSARKGQSWHAYEAQKKLRQRILELERQLAAAQGGKS